MEIISEVVYWIIIKIDKHYLAKTENKGPEAMILAFCVVIIASGSLHGGLDE
jgi:hypothetical protein